MRAGVEHLLLAEHATRVDKPRKAEAAGAGCDLNGQRLAYMPWNNPLPIQALK